MPGSRCTPFRKGPIVINPRGRAPDFVLKEDRYVSIDQVKAALDGKHLLDYTLAAPVSGRVGVWSKTDSVSYFDDYTVTQ